MQSDTWALAGADVRPWLLMLWTTAWQQVPCGSMPADDELVAARLGMKPTMFKKVKSVLMRGWWQADDGRLYHPTITELVNGMLGRKESERLRKAEYRARMEAERKLAGLKVSPDLSHGTDMGQTWDSGGRDGTGTGTGTGLSKGIGKHATRAPDPEPGGACYPDIDPDPGSPTTASLAGAVCVAMRAEGVATVNPSHPELLALIDAGAPLDAFVQACRMPKAKTAHNAFAYVLGTVKGQMGDAAVIGSDLAARPAKARAAAPEPAWRTEQRDRMARFAPGALSKQRRPDNVIDMEEVNVRAIR